MKHIDVNSNTYIDITVSKEDKDSKVEVCGYVKISKYN